MLEASFVLGVQNKNFLSKTRNVVNLKKLGQIGHALIGFVFFLLTQEAVAQDTNATRNRGELHNVLVQANAVLAEHPNHAPSLLTIAIAHLELGNYDSALWYAAKAYRVGTDAEQKLQAARFAATAHFRVGNYTRAEWWLRLAHNHVFSTEQEERVARDFQAVRRENPFRAHLSFSVTPSSNINGGARQKDFILEGLPLIFELGPNALALEGIEYSGSATLSYRLSQNSNQITIAGLSLYGRTYSLSPASQARVPNVSGSDYSLTQVEASIRRRQLLFRAWGPTDLSFHLGQVWYGGDPLHRYGRVSVAQAFALSERSGLRFQTFVEKRRSLSLLAPDSTLYEVQGIFSHRLNNQDLIQLSVRGSEQDSNFSASKYTDTGLSVSYSRARPIFGANISLALGYGEKVYEESALTLNGRYDSYITLDATASFREYTYLGFAPTVTISASKTTSNDPGYDASVLQARIGIESVF